MLNGKFQSIRKTENKAKKDNASGSANSSSLEEYAYFKKKNQLLTIVFQWESLNWLCVSSFFAATKHNSRI